MSKSEPLIELENVTFSYPDFADRIVFSDLTLGLPPGIVSLVGQNGTGKSTLLLLAAGSVLPQEGRVRIMGIDTAELRDEHERQRYVSYVFQNMEFETEEPAGALLDYVYENGFHEDRSKAFLDELIDVFELKRCLDKRTQEISKGEMQRVILAFSLLYGSKILVLDEPIFALEDYQKTRALDYLTGYARKEGVSLYFSLHELELSKKYSDHTLLFYKDQRIILGPTEQVFTRDNIEEAFQIPYHMLKIKQALYREMLTAAERDV